MGDPRNLTVEECVERCNNLINDWPSSPSFSIPFRITEAMATEVVDKMAILRKDLIFKTKLYFPMWKIICKRIV
jgi:hypothetical protein